MGTGKDFITFALLCVYFTTTTKALYEDQIGKFDWRHQYTGKAKLVLFDSSSTATKKIITATEQNVIASINAKTGQIVWRQILEKGVRSRIDDVVLDNGNLITVLGGGTYIRCMSTNAGDLVWENNLDEASPNNQGRLVIIDDEVYVLAGDKVASYDTRTGEEEWVVSLENKNMGSYRYIAKAGNGVAVVGTTPGSHYTVVIIETTGQEQKSVTIPALWSTSDDECVVSNGNQLICIDNKSGALQTLDLESAASFHVTYFQDLGLSANKATFQRTQDGSTQYAIVHLEPTNTAVITAEAGRVRLVKLLPGAAAAQVVNHNDRALVFDVVKYAPNTMQGSAFDLATGDVINELSITITYADHHGKPNQVYALSFKKRDGTPVVKLLLLSEDHSMVMLQTTGKLAWTREEALASIVSVEMVDLPVSPILAKMEDEFGVSEGLIAMFMKRFTTQFLQLKDFILLVKNKILLPRSHHHSNVEADVVVGDSDEEEDDYLTRDEFNLHKMVVVVTQPGKIFGLLSDGGKPEWKHYLMDVAPFSTSGRMPLFVQRTTAHFPNAPIATVFGMHKVTGETVVYSFDPITGEKVRGMPEQGQPMGYQLQQVILLTHMSDAFVRPVVIMDTQLMYHVYPESLHDLVVTLAPSLYMFTCDRERSSLTGYNVKPQGEKLIAQDLWTVSLKKELQRITHVVSKRVLEHVHSQGVVLGDRNVLYKYINPNLVVVVAEGADNQAKSYFNVYLVDVITGHIPFHCNHKRARGPINVVHSENWVVYTYWNERHRRNEVAVIELYEGRQQSNATAFSSLSPPPAPMVLRQSYILNAHVTAAQATLTEKGLTHKQVILALEMGGVLGMPKQLLDARRPLTPTQESREEGLMPYMPELPRPFEMQINYNQSVYNIRAIHSAPAGLESTSLVLCYGLDLFFTRVMPSKMFDVLKEDFEYFFISAVLGGMILVSIITRKLAQRKALAKAWK